MNDKKNPFLKYVETHASKELLTTRKAGDISLECVLDPSETLNSLPVTKASKMKKAFDSIENKRASS
ncbi:MAG: hypothetical protein SVC26_05365 [Pseudomonadota bacterium]|nr:hypothetical protein [Pseudomonadota bacterium]